MNTNAMPLCVAVFFRAASSAIAQFSAYYEQLQFTPDNCSMLLIDHQAGLFLGVKSIDQQILKNNVIGLAKTAKVFDLPTVLFTSSAQGPNGPTIPEIKELFPDHKIHDRSPINLWNDPECRQAVEATNRKKLIMAAITTDVCLAFPALAAIKAGYDVYAVIDASGYLDCSSRISFCDAFDASRSNYDQLDCRGCRTQTR